MKNQDIVNWIKNDIIGSYESPISKKRNKKNIKNICSEKDKTKLVIFTVARIVAYWKESSVKVYLFCFQLSMIK